jgi:hypothetical protein
MSSWIVDSFRLELDDELEVNLANLFYYLWVNGKDVDPGEATFSILEWGEREAGKWVEEFKDGWVVELFVDPRFGVED